MPKKKLGSAGNVYEQKDCKGYVIRWVDSTGRRRGRVLRGATVKEARSVLAAEKHKIEQARMFGAPLPSDETFAHWADTFLAIQENKITAHVIRGKLSRVEFVRQRGIVEKHLKPFFGATRLAMIRKSDVVKYIHARTGRVASGSIIKEVNVLKRLLNEAVDQDKIQVNPAQRAKLPQAPEGRARYLTREQWHAVFTACFIPEEQEQWLQQAAGLAVSLGLRRGELLSITPADVDLDAGHVKLRHTKSGRPRTVPINDLAMTVFLSMGIRERRQERRLFAGIDPARLSMRFLRSARKAGVEDFSFHDLRHTYASHLKMGGTDLFDLQKLLGHSDPRMTSVYAHLSADHLKAAAAKLDGVLTLPAKT